MRLIIVAIVNAADCMPSFDRSIGVANFFRIIVLDLSLLGQIRVLISLFVFCQRISIHRAAATMIAARQIMAVVTAALAVMVFNVQRQRSIQFGCFAFQRR